MKALIIIKIDTSSLNPQLKVLKAARPQLSAFFRVRNVMNYVICLSRVVAGDRFSQRDVE